MAVSGQLRHPLRPKKRKTKTMSKTKTTKKPAAKAGKKVPAFVQAAKAMAAKSALKTQPVAKAPVKANGEPNKRSLCAALLTRASGCTSRDLLDATGWPAISVPATAKASGLKLRKEKVGKVTTYYGTSA